MNKDSGVVDTLVIVAVDHIEITDPDSGEVVLKKSGITAKDLTQDHER